MKQTKWLNFGIAKTVEEAISLCDQWIGGGFYQEDNNGEYNCFSCAEFQRKIKAGEFDSSLDSKQ